MLLRMTLRQKLTVRTARALVACYNSPELPVEFPLLVSPIFSDLFFLSSSSSKPESRRRLLLPLKQLLHIWQLSYGDTGKQSEPASLLSTGENSTRPAPVSKSIMALFYAALA